MQEVRKKLVATVFIPLLIIGCPVGTAKSVGEALAAPVPFLQASGDADGDSLPDAVEPAEGRNPADKDNDIFTLARLFVMQQYRDFLGREGDAAGIVFWTNQLNSGAQSRVQMVDSFFTSAEFAAVNPVARLYFAYFLRIPDYAGLLYWVGQYRAGSSLDAISQAFASSPEFQNTYGSLTNSQFVSLVYQNVLGRPADAGGLAYWTGQVNSGAMTRGQVMLAFSESQENLAVSFNKVFVVQIYVGMLRRSPEQGGFDYWVGQLNGGRSGLDLIGGFLASNEYLNRFVHPTADVIRFLEQATFGPTSALITYVQGKGFQTFIEEQVALPMSSYPSMPLQVTTVPPGCDSICQRDNYSHYLLQRRFFTNALYGQDQLRQRVALALHKIIVVSGRDLMQPSWMVPYLQIFDRNAFGNYRQILDEITLNPAMGRYLDMASSTRTNPNENYPREILQLFSIGVEKLNLDGTPQLDTLGEPIPTYDQAVVEGFTKVFTGWTYAAQPAPGVANYIDPMVLNATRHDTGTKLLLNGVTLPAGQTGSQDMSQALDNIFNHPNVGPFLSKQLIRQLVTSNPTPAYVQRVATIFNNNGAGVRGDLKAVVKAILLDPEARGTVKNDPNYGRLREPVQFVCNLLRAFDARSADRLADSDGYLNPQTSNMEQDILRPSTVFSYFPSDFEVPGASGIAGPEFGILSTSSSLRRANFVNTIVFSTIGTSTNAPNGTSIGLAGLQALAANPPALVDELNRLLLHNTMSSEMRASILTAVNAVSSSNTLKRARTALYLVATSSQYQVQR